MGVASRCGEQEVGVASGSGWNLWVWLLGVAVRRYIDFLILLIPTPLVSVLFCSFLNEYRKSTYQELDQIPPWQKIPCLGCTVLSYTIMVHTESGFITCNIVSCDQ